MAGFIARLLTFDGHPTKLVGSCDDASAPLIALAQLGAVTIATDLEGSLGAYYLPTWRARERLGVDSDESWPSAVAVRQRKVIRSTPGAIISLPLESPPSEEWPTVDVFITDWSPSPGACAVAIHPSHPLSPGLPDGESACFSGIFCRHPLTGDLLPIWVADWVKPTFGTGAVWVNPAHDNVDLAFSRKVGLPIRFALVDEGYDGSPATWPRPPVIKSGVAVRSGPTTDGLGYQEARISYFTTLAERGLARTHVDHGTTPFLVAELSQDGATELGLRQGRRTIAAPDDPDAEPSRWSPSPLLGVIPELDQALDLEVVTPSGMIETDLLALRLLLAEPYFENAASEAPNVTTVTAIVGQPPIDGSMRRLVLLVGAAPNETLAVKPPLIESVQRFLEAHETIVRLPTDEGEETAEVSRSASRIKALLQKRDLKQAFAQLYRLQKTLAKSSSLSHPDRQIYEALAFVLAGLDGRLDNSLRAEAWCKL